MTAGRDLPVAGEKLSRALLERVTKLGQKLAGEKGRKLKFMEVCGTHTSSFARSGVASLVAEFVDLRSGPGCPVCVIHQQDLDQMISLAGLPGTLIATFGDLLRVPGTYTTLERERSKGARVHICYSPLEAVALAEKNRQLEVIFLGIGFETTSPAVAATLLEAKKRRLKNFNLYCSLKLVPPAMEALLQRNTINLDGLILPGHVSTVLGRSDFDFLARFGIPSAVGGFETADLLIALLALLEMITENRVSVVNAYSHVVREDGNPRARELIDLCFEKEPATLWRGLGEIPASGYRLKPPYQSFDAKLRHPVKLPPVKSNPCCKCGEVIMGEVTPYECPLFNSGCTPLAPAGPCMVSSEGACSAYYQYKTR